MTDDLACWLVIENHAWRFFRIDACNGSTIHTHRIIFANTLTNVGRLTIDRNATSNDEFFHFTT
jgi:hypothetical protein